MTFYVEREEKGGFSFDEEALAARVGQAVEEAEGIPAGAEVSLRLVGDEEIRRLNANFRRKDEVTDVLSFPAYSFEAPADFAALEEEIARDTDPETGAFWFGDIVLNVRRVKEQADEYGHSEEREFAFLLAHSLLHLSGYDHETEEEEKVMEAKQEAALRSIGLTREA